jgi:hypothetical protein
MVVGDKSLEMLQGFTRSKADLLYSLNHLPAALPYKEMNGAFAWERFAQSIDALQQIALQNKGVPGRKNIVWVGHGGPGIYLDALSFSGKVRDELKEYAHETTNMLVDARVSLFVIYPGLKVSGNVISLSAMESDIDLGDSYPFAGDINFGVFVNETGGKLFFNRNDVDKLIGRSQRLGSEYYTLTYQPHSAADDGKFRRIHDSARSKSGSGDQGGLLCARQKCARRTTTTDDDEPRRGCPLDRPLYGAGCKSINSRAPPRHTYGRVYGAAKSEEPRLAANRRLKKFCESDSGCGQPGWG